MMKTIMAAKSPHESSLSFSRRHFQQIIKKVTGEDEEINENLDDLNQKKKDKKKKKSKNASRIKKLRMAFSAAIGIGRRHRPAKTVVGTLFGHRRGHVHFAFQSDPKSAPILLIELAMPTAALVREMASGLVRIALECDADVSSGDVDKKDRRRSAAAAVSEESRWRGYCNGKRCGFATRRWECGEKEWRVLRAVEPVTMGAGVLPGGGPQLVGEMMYMRARFERVVGSADSEAFYMMNPDGRNSGTELSLYLLRL